MEHLLHRLYGVDALVFNSTTSIIFVNSVKFILFNIMPLYWLHSDSDSI